MRDAIDHTVDASHGLPGLWFWIRSDQTIFSDVRVVNWILALAKECRWFFGLQRDAVLPAVLALGAVLIAYALVRAGRFRAISLIFGWKQT